MKTTSLFLTMAFLAATALAQNADEAFLAQFQKTFETGGVVEAGSFIPENLMQGPLHRIGTQAFNDGMNNTYVLDADGQQIEVTGRLALRTRVREIYALDSLRRMSKSEEFAKAIGTAGKKKVEGVVNIVKDPRGTVANLPKGASRFFGRIGESAKGGKSEGEDNALQSLTGVSKAKAKLAADLGVSPYTLNEELQRELTDTARAMAGGGLVVTGALAAVGGGAGTAISALGANQTLQQTLVTTTPSDLRILNRKKLFALGVDRALADEFLMHPWYTPWYSTITTDALDSIGVNPAVFLENACRALTAEDALFFQRLAQVLARYHAEKAPLQSIRVECGVICGRDNAGVLVVPLSCDYAIWAERAARRAEAFGTLIRGNPDIKGVALWVDGKVSERLAQELGARRIEVKTDVLNGR